MISKIKNNLSNTGLSNAVINKIQNAFKKFAEIETVILYGSRAMGNFRNGSDIDLTIKLKSNYVSSIRLLNQISMMIDDLNLIYSFDLSLFDDISNDDLIEHINRVGIEFYS